MNVVDRMIAWANPQAGVARAQARRDLAVADAAAVRMDNGASGYDVAGSSLRSMRRYQPRARSADADIALALQDLRAKSRDLARNNPLAGGALCTIVSRVVGTGLALQCRPNTEVLGWTDEQTEQWRKSTQAEFSLWADSRCCDLARKGDFYDLQELVFRSVLESGDSLTLLAMRDSGLLPYQLALQIIEADRVGNENGQSDSDRVTQGVEFDPDTGATQRFFVYDRHPGSTYGQTQKWAGRWVPALTSRGMPAVLHHMRMLRPGQSRGVPHLAPVIDALKQLGRFTDAEMMAAVVAGMYTVFIKSEAPEQSPLLAPDAPDTALAENEITLGNGAVVGLSPGEDVETSSPGRPNPEFDPFVMAILRQIGVGLEVPFEVLVKHFTSSYSAARAALLDAWVFFKGRRDWLRKSFCQPVYETWLEEAVALGRVQAPGFFRDPALRAAYCRADWTGDAPGAIDPEKEVRAKVAAIDAGLTTHESAEMELFGTDWNATTPQKIREHEVLMAAGIGAAAAPVGAPAEEPIDPDEADKADRQEKDPEK